MRCDGVRTDQTHTTDGHRGILAQASRASRVAQDRNQTVHDGSDEGLELGCCKPRALCQRTQVSDKANTALTILGELQSNLTHSPSSVVTHADLGI